MLKEIDFLEMHVIERLKWLYNNTTIENITYFYSSIITKEVGWEDIDLEILLHLFEKYTCENRFIKDYDPEYESSPKVMQMLESLDGLSTSADSNEVVFFHIAATWTKEDSSVARLEESIGCALMAHVEKMLWSMKERVGVMLKV